MSTTDTEHYSRAGTVLVMLPPSALATAVRKAALSAGVKIYWATRDTDLVAVPAFLTILDPTRLNQAGWDLLVDYTTQAQDREHKILLACPSPHQGGLPSPNLVEPPAELDEPFLRFLMLRVRAVVGRRRRVEEKRERQILRLLWIIRLLDLGKAVRQRDICAEFSVTPRTFQRDVLLLELARFPIESAGKGAYRFPAGEKSYHRYWPLTGR